MYVSAGLATLNVEVMLRLYILVVVAISLVWVGNSEVESFIPDFLILRQRFGSTL